MRIIMQKALLTLLFVFILPVTTVLAGGGDTSQDKADDSGPIFVEIDQIVVPIIKRNGKTGMISLSLVAEVNTEEENQEIQNYMPRLKDAYIRSLYGNVIAKRLSNENGTLDMMRLKEHLIKTTNYVLKSAHVNDILLNHMAQHSF